MPINAKLRATRALYNINQTVLAEAANINIRTYSNKERRGTFSQIEMVSILEFFKKYNPDLTLDDIFLNR